jgi:hypothetical protein
MTVPGIKLPNYGSLPALQRVGNPRELLAETKIRMFAA